MTRDELNALPAGTEVLIRVRLDGDVVRHLPAASVHSIAPPKPVPVAPLAPGDMTNGGRIIAIHGGEAWVDSHTREGCLTHDLAHLRRVSLHHEGLNHAAG